MDAAGRAILAIVGSIMTLAILSVVLSQKANTSGVIQSASGGLASLITAAEAPVSGGSASSSSGLNTFNSVLAALGSGVYTP